MLARPFNESMPTKNEGCWILLKTSTHVLENKAKANRNSQQKKEETKDLRS